MASTQEQLTLLMDTGKEHLSNNDYASAEKNFVKVIEQAPLFPAAYLNCAMVQFFQQKNVEALMNLDAAIALISDDQELAGAYHNRALVNIELNSINEAISDLKTAAALGSEDSETELERVSKLQGSKNNVNPEALRAKVQSLCDEARKAYSTNPLDALVLFKKASDLAPKSIDAIYGIGLANSALGRMDQALEGFDVVLSMVRPEYAGLKAETLYNRSALFKQIGDSKQAIADLEECLSLSLDESVRFPVMGSAEQEAEMIESIRLELEKWKEEAST